LLQYGHSSVIKPGLSCVRASHPPLLLVIPFPPCVSLFDLLLILEAESYMLLRAHFFFEGEHRSWAWGYCYWTKRMCLSLHPQNPISARLRGAHMRTILERNKSLQEIPVRSRAGSCVRTFYPLIPLLKANVLDVSYPSSGLDMSVFDFTQD